MLVLSRRPGESILIESGIEITVIELRSGKVRLGIRAPDAIRIRRQEIAFEAPQDPGLSHPQNSGVSHEAVQ
jgi:carbon storage regulator